MGIQLTETVQMSVSLMSFSSAKCLLTLSKVMNCIRKKKTIIPAYHRYSVNFAPGLLSCRIVARSQCWSEHWRSDQVKGAGGRKTVGFGSWTGNSVYGQALTSTRPRGQPQES